MAKRNFFIFTLILAGFLILPEISLAVDEDTDLSEIGKYLELPAGKVEDLIHSLINIFHSKWEELMVSPHSTPEEMAVPNIMKRVVQVQALNYLLIDAPLETTYKIIKGTTEIARIFLATDIVQIIEKLEQESVKRAVEYGMNYLLQNEIKVTPGTMEFEYKLREGGTGKALIQYIMIYKPSDAKKGEMVVRFYSAESLKPPKSKSSYGGLMNTYNELEHNLPPFVVEISGLVENYKWDGDPSVNIDFPPEVPDLGIKPLSRWEKYVLKPITDQIKKTRIVLEKVLEKSGGIVDNLKDLGEKIVKEVKSFWGKIKDSISWLGAQISLPWSSKKTTPEPPELEGMRETLTSLKEELDAERKLRNDLESKYGSETAALIEKLDDLTEMVDALSQRGSEVTESEVRELIEKLTEAEAVVEEVEEKTGEEEEEICWVNINTASAEKLQKIIGVGSVIAQRIIEARPFYSLSDLIRVNGIGEVTLQKIIEQDCAYVDESYSGFATSGGGGAPPPSEPTICSQENLSLPTHSLIIINEVAWMGTSSTNWRNEWIELKNISATDVSLVGWQLLDKDEEIKIIFDDTDSIPAGDFYLLEWKNDDTVPNVQADKTYSGNLKDNDESLRLFDENCNLIDEVRANVGENLDWPAGDKQERRSMERSQDLAWHTYSGQGENGLMGTPKAENSQPSDVARPILAVLPESLEFTAVEFRENPDSQNLTINNIGEGTLEWTSSVEYTLPSMEGINWLDLNPDSGTAPSQVLVSPDISGLTVGTYLATITIEAGQIQGSPAEIEVNLDIRPAFEEEQPTKILITEIQILPIDQRFIELYNPNNESVDLTGWYIQRKTKTGTSWSSLVTSTQFEGKTIGAKKHFLVARSGEPDILLPTLTLTEDNSLRLRNPNRETVDLVGWGQAQEFETAPAENPPSDKSSGRKWSTTIANYIDTDNNQFDFEIQNPTPKSKNLSIEEPPPVFEIAVSEADTVWNLNLSTASADVIDSTDAPPHQLEVAFVSHADSVLSLDFPLILPDILDSTDAPSQVLTEAYVSHGDSTWKRNLEKSF